MRLLVLQNSLPSHMIPARNHFQPAQKDPLHHLVNPSAMTPRAAEGAANAVGKNMIIAQNSNCLSNDLCMGLLLSKE